MNPPSQPQIFRRVSATIHQLMIHCLTHEESTAARCLDLIWRHAPLMMKAGGGALGGEAIRTNTGKPWRYSSPEEKELIVQLAREGKLTTAEIAKKVGASASATYKIIERAGLRAKSGKANSITTLTAK